MPQHSKKKKNAKNLPKSKIRSFIGGIKYKIDDFMARRPHRSFRLTRRRDYVRPLTLPGYFAFNNHVNKTLFNNKATFIWLGICYAVLYGILIGVGSQETYQSLSMLVQEAGTELLGGDFTQIGQAGLVFVVAASTGLNASLTEAQQIYAVILVLLIWLTTVWLLRNRLAGHKVSLRDGLYNAGTPIVSTALVFGLIIIQLIPVGLAALGYSLANNAGLLAGGFGAMFFWIAACLLGVLSLFWITSTLFAMIIVTIPGMYPLKAVKNAGDLVLGRRIKILLRWLWMVLSILVIWTIILIPTILIETWLRSIWPAISAVPLVPIVILIISTYTAIWTASYIYLLYRKVVDDDAS